MPRRRNGFWRLTALLMATSLVMAACGDDDEAGPEGRREVAIAFVGASSSATRASWASWARPSRVRPRPCSPISSRRAW